MSKVAEADPIVKGEPELFDWRNNLRFYRCEIHQLIFDYLDGKSINYQKKNVSPLIFLWNSPTEGSQPTLE